MRIKTKMIITFVSLLLFMLLLPWLALRLSDPTDAMGIFVLAFFVVNPLITVLLSAMAGSDISKLWWLPLAIAVLFPLFFSIAIGGFVLDLYFYSLIYLLLGALSMTCRYMICKLPSKKTGRESKK